ncbi:MAG: hypothetical protein HZA34_00455 [Candidatus Pacebacteria bacterium]|nr:hypothetical protein [Candidatus Paceibacterota bacterium]
MGDLREIGNIVLKVDKAVTMGKTRKVLPKVSHLKIDGMAITNTQNTELRVLGEEFEDINEYLRKHEEEIINILSESGLIVQEISAEAAEAQKK